MKRIFVIFHTFLIFFSMISCSNNVQNKDNSKTFETLKEESEYINSTVVWTEEIEKNRLTASINLLDRIFNKQKLSPLAVNLRKIDEEASVYPFLDGFGSLDNSLISSSLESFLNGFFESLSTYESCDAYMKEESLYILALFYYDLDKILPEYSEKKVRYDEAFKKKQEAAEKEKKDGETPETELKKETIRFFDRYFYGEPFLNGVYYELPVRLKFGKKFIDLNAVAVSDNGQWKMDQLHIVYLEKGDE